MTPWEKPVRHHKWADELEAEAKAKSILRVAKLEAKAEDHSKRCPYCGHSPVENAPLHPGLAPDDPDNLMWTDCHHCPSCKSLYRVNCPGTILLDSKPHIVRNDAR